MDSGRALGQGEGMSTSYPIQGHCHPRFARVREAFEHNLRARNECGAAVSIVHDGEPVVDLWAGWADQARTQPWQEDTIVNVYSCTKGMAALCLQRLVSEGKVDLDAPVARYWPEFGQAGKERLPVRWLLSHRAGLAAVRDLLPNEALYDFDAMTAALAAERPWWEPGSAHGYHAVTFGWLVGEVVRRVTGKSVGTYFRESVAGPLAADFHIGLDDAHHDRVAEMSAIPMPEPDHEAPQLAAVIMQDPEGLAARAFMNPPSMAFGVNNPAWRSAEIPGANGTANARAMARIYGALARGGRQDGVDVLDRSGVRRCAEENAHGRDLVLQVDTRFGLGFMLPQSAPETHVGRGEHAFGHPGAGGHVGFADPDEKLGFGYVINRMGPHILLDPRAVALIDAAYECV
jgi:CubicO group peptidase (beta-lactamase class C family)